MPQMKFVGWDRFGGTRFQPYDEVVRAGDYSDDTQLALCVARALTRPDWLRWFRLREFPGWLLYERGGGIVIKRAAKAWMGGGTPWTQPDSKALTGYFQAGSNGAAMRIAPHAFVTKEPESSSRTSCCTRSPATATPAPSSVRPCSEQLSASSLAGRGRSPTAPFPRNFSIAGRSGATGRRAWTVLPEEWVHAFARVDSFEETWSATVAEVERSLAEIRGMVARGPLADDAAMLASLGCIDDKVSGAGTVTALGAIYLVSCHAANPQAGLLGAAFLPGGDTDTLWAPSPERCWGVFTGRTGWERSLTNSRMPSTSG